MWLLLENAKQETRIIRVASVTITSPGIMMMGRNLSQARDRLLGIFQKTSPSLPRLFFTSLPPPRFVHCRSQRFSPKRRLCSPSAQRPLRKLQNEPEGTRGDDDNHGFKEFLGSCDCHHCSPHDHQDDQTHLSSKWRQQCEKAKYFFGLLFP